VSRQGRYSRIMKDDEELAISTLTSNREMMSTPIKQDQRQLVDSPGFLFSAII
jgi:hypothetical protein